MFFERLDVDRGRPGVLGQRGGVTFARVPSLQFDDRQQTADRGVVGAQGDRFRRVAGGRRGAGSGAARIVIAGIRHGDSAQSAAADQDFQKPSSQRIAGQTKRPRRR